MLALGAAARRRPLSGGKPIMLDPLHGSRKAHGHSDALMIGGIAIKSPEGVSAASSDTGSTPTDGLLKSNSHGRKTRPLSASVLSPPASSARDLAAQRTPPTHPMTRTISGSSPAARGPPQFPSVASSTSVSLSAASSSTESLAATTSSLLAHSRTLSDVGADDSDHFHFPVAASVAARPSQIVRPPADAPSSSDSSPSHGIGDLFGLYGVEAPTPLVSEPSLTSPPIATLQPAYFEPGFTIETTGLTPIDMDIPLSVGSHASVTQSSIDASSSNALLRCLVNAAERPASTASAAVDVPVSSLPPPVDSSAAKVDEISIPSPPMVTREPLNAALMEVDTPTFQFPLWKARKSPAVTPSRASGGKPPSSVTSSPRVFDRVPRTISDQSPRVFEKALRTISDSSPIHIPAAAQPSPSSNGTGLSG